MLNVPLDTKQVISGRLFPDNLLVSTEKNSKRNGDAKYKTQAITVTKSIITQSTKQQKHRNIIMQNKHNKLKTRFGRLLQCPSWKWSRPILEGMR